MEIIWENKPVQHDNFKIFEANLREISFRDGKENLSINLSINEAMSMKTTKRIILEKFEWDSTWIKFFLNEQKYNDQSKVNKLSKEIGLIKVNVFTVENLIMKFNYSGYEFEQMSKNNETMGNIERYIKNYADM